jgi:signal transduction histidine kinase
MKISSYADFRSAIFPSILAQTTTGSRKPKSRELWRTVVWPVALACGFLVVTGSSLYLVASVQSTSALVSRTLEVEDKLSVMLAIVRDAESGQRGYLLTGNPDYLDVYRIATNAIRPAIDDLKAAVIDDPTQRKALSELEPLLERKFAELGETIRLYTADDRAAALALVQTDVGHDLMTKISAMTASMTDEKQRFLSVRTSNSVATNSLIFVVDLIGLALVTVLAIVSLLVMRRLAAKEVAYRSDLERSNQDLDDFAHIASHDLKEPLRGLFNHASFLLEDYKDKIDEDGVRRLTRIGQLCQRMERLINDLMYFSRLGRADLAVRETDPNAVIVEIRQMMQTLLSERNARIVVPRTLPQIVCDKTRVTEVFRNLITNAVKYNDKTEPLVEIGFLDSAADTEERNERNVFYVKDNGIGIDPEFHQEIFRIFKRLQNASDASDTGTGVGLTFVKKIVERHGGRVWLKSESGKGTIFYFSLDPERNKSARNAHDRAIEPSPAHSAG